MSLGPKLLPSCTGEHLGCKEKDKKWFQPSAWQETLLNLATGCTRTQSKVICQMQATKRPRCAYSNQMTSPIVYVKLAPIHATGGWGEGWGGDDFLSRSVGRRVAISHTRRNRSVRRVRASLTDCRRRLPAVLLYIVYVVLQWGWGGCGGG